MVNNTSSSGIILFAKQSGLTSFSSLGAIKKALHTNKVGHTGTLDSFAEGLMVVLTGSLTRLAPYFTAADKKYLAVVKFGSETDTLEVSGKVIKTGPVPTKEQILSVLDNFKGSIQQIPPLYSAIHVEGKRASDIVRSGKELNIPSRQVEIYLLELLDFQDGYGLLEVHCSKGTYIRSLARDIGQAVGSCAYLVALRRTAVGDFKLEDGLGLEYLQPFSIKSRGLPDLSFNPEVKDKIYSTDFLKQIQQSLRPLSPKETFSCSLGTLFLKPEKLFDFRNGKPLQKSWFFLDTKGKTQFNKLQGNFSEYAVFSPTEIFLGIVKIQGCRIKYGFVVPGEANGDKGI